MRPGTLLRLALAGTRTDTVRVLLTAAATGLATLAVLATATVLAIVPRADFAPHEVAGSGPTGPDELAVVPAMDGYAYQYTSNLLVEPGLRPGVALALLLLCVPVLALAGQAAQLGAPARARRLAQVRLAGATPRQAVMVAVAETGLAGLLGTLLGTAAYFVGRAVWHQPDPDGRLPLPTDQLPPVWSHVTVVLGLPLLAAGFAALLLRRVAFTPFGLVRRQRSRPPRPWPAALIALGLSAFVAVAPLSRAYQRGGEAMPDWMAPALLGGGALLAALGVILGTGWISYATGRLLPRLVRTPSALIAARRLAADPWTGSRVFAALLAGTMVGAGAAGVRALFAAEFDVQEQANRAMAAAQGSPHIPADNSFYFASLNLVDLAVTVGIAIAGLGLLVFVAEGLVSRRRAHSALVAAGVPRRTLAGAVGWQALAPLVPAILLTLTVGVSLARGIAREVRAGGGVLQICEGEPEQCQEAGSPLLRVVQTPEFVRPVEIPFVELAQVGGVAMAAVLVTTVLGLAFLRASIDTGELRAI